MIDENEARIAQLAKTLGETQFALFDVMVNDLFTIMTVREADLIVKKFKSIRKSINNLIGEEKPQKGTTK